MDRIGNEEIMELAGRFAPDAIGIRHRIHQNPELAGEEYQTAATIRQALAVTAAEILPPFLDTDVVALLSGGAAGPNVTLRADMDALPLDELNDLPYKSTRPGIMHACGHDAHAAMLTGAALALNALRDRFAGSVRFVFQPGEEVAALGRDLVFAGALTNPEPKAVFALHGAAGFPAGAIAGRPGPMMAAAGFFKITIIGKGGHGSRPELAIDPILTAARLVEALQGIVARQIDPQDAAVISVCRFESGKNCNVIPEQAELEGTTRFLSPAVGDVLPELIEKTVKGVCLTTGADYRFDYRLPYRPVINDAACVDRAREIVTAMFGEKMWHELPRSSMGAEDFCYYLDRYPGAYCNIGIGCDRPGIHNPRFDFNDDAIRNGIAFLVAIALKTLQG